MSGVQNSLLSNQTEERKYFLDKILKSKSPRKIIVAGPGTGKTFTFGEVFRKSDEKNNLAITFIRKLVAEMEKELSDYSEVKTFHAYCKKLLHQQNGRVDLFPFLTKVIQLDSEYLNLELSNFDDKFQILADDSPEVNFYLNRGDYYEAVSFNDSVYRLYRSIKDGICEVPLFNQIVVDEFQDFNPLEVAFIEELEKKSPVLIVGDDDQAVYISRNSSPEYLQKKYRSGNYQVFQLPYCTRCPKVIVEATTSFILNAIEKGGLQSRIERPFIPFLDGKEKVNDTYPKIIRATTTNIPCLARFIINEIHKIPVSEIIESQSNSYPTVMLVGKKQYLNPLSKSLKREFSNVVFHESQDIDFSIVDAYEILIKDRTSNLGWRILAELEFSGIQLVEIIKSSINGTPMINILPKIFILRHELIIDQVRKKSLSAEDMTSLKKLLGSFYIQVISHFINNKEEIEIEVDLDEPSILLTSFEGCKGLSAGKVFIVGLNDGVVPAKGREGRIDDIEYCKFVVALTRTRNCCYLLSNRWDYSPVNIRPFASSLFINLIPSKMIDDLGYLRSKDI